MRIAVQRYFNEQIKSLIIKHPGTDSATILRGIAALLVVLIHFDGFGTRNLFPETSVLRQFVIFIVNMGVYGPLIFFIASGFALTASYAKKSISFVHYMFQRIFRLLPLYATVLIVTFIFRPLRGPTSFGLDNFLAHISFLDPFLPQYFRNDPVGVISSIPIEFWWSMSIPMIFWARSKSKAFSEVLFIAVAVPLIFISDEHLNKFEILEGLRQSGLLKYGIYFYVGNLVWRIRPYVLKSKYRSLYFAISTLALICLQQFRVASEVKVSVFSIIFLIFLKDIKTETVVLDKLNNFFLGVGTICYSIYLWHYPILRLVAPLKGINLLYMPLTLLTIFIFSVVSYLLIESKGIRLGKTLWLLLKNDKQI